MIVVATAKSRKGGRCQRCGRRIKPGQTIHKIDLGWRGSQTAGKNGQGSWWCTECAPDAPLPAA